MRQPADGAAGRRPGGPLLPRAVPARPALHARRVGRADGGGRCAGDRPPLRPLRRGLGLLQPLGPDRNVDVGQRRRPHLGVGPGAGAGGDVDGGGRRLPGPARRRSSRPGSPSSPGPAPAAPSASPGASPATRASRRSCPVPAVPPAGSASAAISASPPASNTALRGNLGNTLVMQVRAQRPSYWVGETFDTWEGQSWTESQPVPRRPLARELALRPPDPAGRRAVRAERPADLLRRERRRRTSCSTPRAPASCGSPPARSTSPPTAPSCRRSAWAAGPSTRSIRRSAPPRPAQLRADDSPFDSLRPTCSTGGAAAARLPPGPRAGPVRHRRTTPRPTTRCSRSSTGSARTPTTRRTSRRCRPAPTPSTSSSSATGSASASRSRPRWP